MLKKLRIKFVVINMTIVTVMMAVIFGMLYFFTEQNLETRADSLLRAVASEPFLLQSPGNSPQDLSMPYFALKLNRWGELIATGGGYYDLSDTEYLQELVDQVKSSKQESGILADQNLRYYQSYSPVGTVIAFSDRTYELTVLSGLRKTLAFVGTIGFLVFLGICIICSWWAVRPVARAWKEQKQFIADASHELKTPLTVIMTTAELLQSPDYDEENRKQFVDSILVMSRQMRSLVEQMLQLARADNQQSQTLTYGDVDLSRLAEDSELSFEALFYEKGLSIDTRIAPDIHVRGDAQALQQVIDILLDNARKYSAPGGETVCTLAAAGHGRCRLTVADPGPQIAPADLKKIFSRFYRIDEARGRDGSFGLGLPIAQQIVTNHHGKIWAESDGEKNTFLVELPTL